MGTLGVAVAAGITAFFQLREARRETVLYEGQLWSACPAVGGWTHGWAPAPGGRSSSQLAAAGASGKTRYWRKGLLGT